MHTKVIKLRCVKQNVILSDSEESPCLPCVKGGVTAGDGGIVTQMDSSKFKFLRMTYFFNLTTVFPVTAKTSF